MQEQAGSPLKFISYAAKWPSRSVIPLIKDACTRVGSVCARAERLNARARNACTRNMITNARVRLTSARDIILNIQADVLLIRN